MTDRSQKTECGNLFFTAERKAHAPQLARAEVDHGVEVIITGNPRKEPASWGCHVAACWAYFFGSLVLDGNLMSILLSLPLGLITPPLSGLTVNSICFTTVAV